MENLKQKMKGIVAVIAIVFSAQLSYGQVWSALTNNGGGDIGFTTSTVTGIGIGYFNTANISSALHVNTNLTSNNSGFNAGQVFRTSGPSGVDHQWRMYNDNSSSNTEKFNVTNPSGTDNVELKAITGAMKFYTDGTQRMCITPASSSG